MESLALISPELLNSEPLNLEPLNWREPLHEYLAFCEKRL